MKIETTDCQHQFWKDRNPPNCFNCGKTEKEISDEFSENMKSKEKKLIIQKIWCQAKQYKVMPKNFLNFLEKLWLDT